MPFNPAGAPVGGQYLFYGISQAGQSLGAGIEREKQRAQQAKGAFQYGTATGAFSKDQAEGMSLEQMKAGIAANEYRNAREQQKREQEHQAIQENYMKAQMWSQATGALQNIMERRQAAQNEAAAPVFYKMLSESAEEPGQAGRDAVRDAIGQPVSRPPGPGLTARGLFGALEKSGYRIPTDDLARFMTAVGKTSVDADGNIRFEQDPVSGNRFAVRDRTVLPSGRDPKMGPAKTLTPTERRGLLTARLKVQRELADTPKELMTPEVKQALEDQLEEYNTMLGSPAGAAGEGALYDKFTEWDKAPK